MAKQPRLVQLNCHRPVNWNESQITKVITRCGYVLGEAKKDGFRFHAFLIEGEVRVVTREGIEIRSLVDRRRYLRSLLETLPAGFIIDGEVVIPGIPFEEASGHLRRFTPIPDHLITKFYVWDATMFSAMQGIEADATPYIERKKFLVQKMRDVPYPSIFVEYIPAKVLKTIEECREFYELTRTWGDEGGVIKDPLSGVKNGKVAGWWKLKPSDTADGKIIGLVWGTPGLANEGKVVGFTVELEDGTVCDATNISKAKMDEFTAEVKRVTLESVGIYSPYGMGGGGLACFANPFEGRYCHISYMEKTKTGSLRHPTFLNFRDLEYAQGFKV